MLFFQKLRMARAAQGSVLQYGLDYHLQRFIKQVSDVHVSLSVDVRCIDR
jgi:hypothetical protein